MPLPGWFTLQPKVPTLTCVYLSLVVIALMDCIVSIVMVEDLRLIGWPKQTRLTTLLYMDAVVLKHKVHF